MAPRHTRRGALVAALAAAALAVAACGSDTSTPDVRSYTFTLREGVTFSDGTPLDANAVTANLDRVAQLGARGTLPKGYLAGYESTTVESPTRFTVAFARPNVQFLQGTSTHSLGILAPATMARSDDERCAQVIGSGPFTVREYTKNASVTLAKRPGYQWVSALFAHPGEAYLDTVSKPVVDDPAVRHALSLAIDRQEVVGGVFTSQTRPTTSVLASTTPSYADDSAALAFDVATARSTDPAKRTQIVAQAQQEMLAQALSVPVVELTTVLGVGPSVHGITFDASSRIQLHNVWKSQQ